MGYQIIKQPDGLLCVWSTYVDNIVVADATAEEIHDHFAEMAAQDSRRQTERLVEMVLSGEKRPYFQFTMAYAEAVERHREMGGDETMICTTGETA